MKNQFRTLCIENDILHILKRQSHQFGIILVVVGDKILLLRCTFGIEIIATFREYDCYRIIACMGSGYLFQSLRHQRGSIIFLVGSQAKVRQVILILCLGAGTEHGQTAKNTNKSPRVFHIIHFLNINPTNIRILCNFVAPHNTYLCIRKINKT